MVNALGDRWSYYIPADEYAAHMEQMNNAYVGVGITITPEEGKGIRILEVVPGGPAEEAGIQVEDIIVKVDGTSIAEMAVSEITAYPLGFILIFDPINEREYEGVDITSFSDCEYDELSNIEIPLCIKEMNDIFPMHYRSKEEIRQCVLDNKRKENELC